MLRNEVLRIAMEEMLAGHGEEGSNNAGQWVKQYLNGLAEPPANWCSAFACWDIMGACSFLGIPMPVKYTLSARNLFNQFRKKNWDLAPSVQPVPGDLVFFWRDDPTTPPVGPSPWMGHVGILKLLSIDDGLQYVVEGNRGSSLAKIKIMPYTFGKTDISDWSPVGLSLDNKTMGFLGYGRLYE